MHVEEMSAALDIETAVADILLSNAPVEGMRTFFLAAVG